VGSVYDKNSNNYWKKNPLFQEIITNEIDYARLNAALFLAIGEFRLGRGIWTQYHNEILKTAAWHHARRSLMGGVC